MNPCDTTALCVGLDLEATNKLLTLIDWVNWINVRDPLYFLGVWDSLYLCKKDPVFLLRVIWAKLRVYGMVVDLGEVIGFTKRQALP